MSVKVFFVVSSVVMWFGVICLVRLIVMVFGLFLMLSKFCFGCSFGSR